MGRLAGMANETRAQEWAAHVAEWRASGGTARTYCAERGLNHRDLYRWAHRLKQCEATPPPNRAIQLVRVDVETKPEAPPAAPRSMLTIEIGEARVTVPAGFDGATVRAVVEALRSTEGRR
jgi:hypothetical protein